MTAREVLTVELRCDYADCPTTIVAPGRKISEVRRAAKREGWLYSLQRDYCTIHGPLVARRQRADRLARARERERR